VVAKCSPVNVVAAPTKTIVHNISGNKKKIINTINISIYELLVSSAQIRSSNIIPVTVII
jgi:hypothetical protein